VGATGATGPTGVGGALQTPGSVNFPNTVTFFGVDGSFVVNYPYYTYDGSNFQTAGTVTTTSLKTATTKALATRVPITSFNNTFNVTTVPGSIAYLLIDDLTQYDALLVAGSFASSYFGPTSSGSVGIDSVVFLLGYSVDNIPAVMNPGEIQCFNAISIANTLQAQCNNTIFKILRKGVDYHNGSSQLNFMVAAPSDVTNTRNFLYNYDYTFAVFPVV
jgi:hypothetical protein